MLAAFTAYRVKYCGIAVEKQHGVKLGNFKEIFENIYTWFKQKPEMLLEDLCTYGVNQDWHESFRETYLLNIVKEENTGDYLLVFWNRTRDNGSSIYGLSNNVKVSELEKNTKSIEGSKLGDAFVPGFATYYWVMPSEGIYVPILFAGSKSNQPAFHAWVHGFIQNESRYAIFENSEFRGYLINSMPQHDIDGKMLVPKFSSYVLHSVAKHDLIRRNRNKIKGIERRTTLKRMVEDQQNWFKNFLGAPSATLVDTPLRFQAILIPSADELDEILNENYTDRKTHSVAILFPANTPGLKEREWLDETLLRVKYNIKVDWVTFDALATANSIMREVSKLRISFLKELSVEVGQNAKEIKVAV